jgi:hypothetical protein
LPARRPRPQSPSRLVVFQVDADGSEAAQQAGRSLGARSRLRQPRECSSDARETVGGAQARQSDIRTAVDDGGETAQGRIGTDGESAQQRCNERNELLMMIMLLRRRRRRRSRCR